MSRENEATIAVMTDRLQNAFNPVELQIIDDSSAHVGHPGAALGGGHFIVKLVSAKFKGLSPIQQHRLVYAELEDLIPHKIHALSLKLTEIKTE